MNAYPAEPNARIIVSRRSGAWRLPFLAAACSLVAALAHAWVVRSHLTHWWGYGAFFAGLAVAQAVYGWAIARYPGRRLALAGVAANLGVLTLYSYSRAVAVPLGPHAGRAETIGIPDLVCAAAEVGLVATLLWMSRGDQASLRVPIRRLNVGAVAVVLIAAGMAGPVGHAHPSPPSVSLSGGQEIWVGALPTPVPATPVGEEPVTEPEPEPIPEEPACGFQGASDITLPEPAGPGEARALVYSSGEGTWMYEPAKNKAQKLFAHAEQCWANDPTFRTPTFVSFHMNSIFGLDLKTGEVVELLSSTDGVMATAWSPDGKTLAYTTYGSDGGGPKLAIYDVSDGSTQVLRTFPEAAGRCGSEDDESSVSWAPDGHALITVITHTMDEDETMFVTDLSGDDLVPPRSGTSARWAPDSKRIYYRDFLGDRKWHTLNSETGDTGTLGAMKPGTYDLAVSPDGGMLAYHDGDGDVATYVFDVATKTQRKIADDAVMAVWLGPRTVLVTDTKPCGDECGHSAWLSKDTTSTIDVFTEERKPAAVPATWAVDAWIEDPADAEQSPSPAPPAPSPTPTDGPTDEPSPLPLPSVTSTSEPSPSPSTEPSPDTSPSPTAG